MIELTLAGKKRTVEEPVFKQLRRLLSAYNALAEGDGPARLQALKTLLDSLGLGSIPLWRLRDGELQALFEAIPALCQLKPVAPGAGGRDFPWGEMYAHLSLCLGWTYDYIDNHMTLSRLAEYQAYFAKHPPTHQLVAAYLGYEPPGRGGNHFLAAMAAQAKAQAALRKPS
jgi:hypothetical protein